MQYDAIDECQFCVREFWRPWLRELLDIEGTAKSEETAATLDIRDATTKSERDFALRRREVAAEAILSIRAAKRAVMDAMDAIDAEKAKRYSIEKEKYGISIKRSQTDTKYQDRIKKAIKAKKIQEINFEIMTEWSKKWALRMAEIEQIPSREDKTIDSKERAMQTITHKKGEKDVATIKQIGSDTSLTKQLTPVKSRIKGGLKRRDSKEKSPTGKGSPKLEKKGSPTEDKTTSLEKKESAEKKDSVEKRESEEKKDSKEKKGSGAKSEKSAESTTDKADKKENADESSKDTASKKETAADKDTSDKKEAATPPKDTTDKKESATPPKDTTDKKESATPPKDTTEKKETAAVPAKDTADKKETTPEPPKDTSNKKEAVAPSAKTTVEKKDSPAAPSKVEEKKEPATPPSPPKVPTPPKAPTPPGSKPTETKDDQNKK